MIEPAKTILVVEDDRDVREVALAVLEGAGYRVLEAASGDDAYQLLLAHPDLEIDLLFTDVVMPGMNGRALADRIRAKRPEIRVLYTTGYKRGAVAHNMLDRGAAFLPKPFTVEQLAAKVRSTLDAPL